MSVFNSENDLKHPAFHDEGGIEKKKTWSRILNYVFKIVVVLGLVAWALFCIWVL